MLKWNKDNGTHSSKKLERLPPGDLYALVIYCSIYAFLIAHFAHLAHSAFFVLFAHLRLLLDFIILLNLHILLTLIWFHCSF